MYRIGRRHHIELRRRIWVGIVVSVFVVAIGLVFVGYRIISAPQIEATLPAAVVHEFAAPETADRLFDEKNFSIKLPMDWRLVVHSDEALYNKYSFQATGKNQDNRWLEVYVDRVPAGGSANRMLPVIVSDNRIVIASSVSENCTTFTGQKTVQPSNISTLPAKWQGVSFDCDIANYARNVVGVGSPENGRNLPLVGATGQKHIYYFVYIDHNSNPDYQILERALSNFSPK